MENSGNLFGDISRARREMEQLMNQVFGETLPLLRPMSRKWRPNVDVFECEDSVIVIAELAGVERDDVSVVFCDGKLQISGIRKDTIPYTSRKYSQMEINYNEFERVIHLPENVDTENISAKLNHGLMIVKAPRKKVEGPRDHRVEIG